MFALTLLRKLSQMKKHSETQAPRMLHQLLANQIPIDTQCAILNYTHILDDLWLY